MSEPPLSPAQLLRQLFIDATTSDLAELAQAMEQGDQGAALHHAHRIHGAALSMGAVALAAMAGTLEEELRASPVGKAHCQLRVAQLAMLMQEWLAGRPTG